MGNNQVYLLNETEDSLRCLTFNNSDMVYWIPRAYLQLPPRQMVTADGLQGGGAVKVGIVYREDMDEGTSYFDLFQVNHGEVLIIKEVNENGVQDYFPPEGPVRLLYRAMSIQDPNVPHIQPQLVLRGVRQ